MDRLGAGGLGGGDDRVTIEIRLARLRRANQMRGIGDGDMGGVAVGLGIDGDNPQAHGLGRARDAASDLPAIGNQQAGKHYSEILMRGVSDANAPSSTLHLRRSEYGKACCPADR